MKRLAHAIAFAMAFLFFGVVGPDLNAPSGVNHGPCASAVTVQDAAASSAATKQQQSAEEFYHSVWKLAKDNFLWQKRLNDWHKWEHKFKGQLKTHQDAERAINQMLGSLNDPYTYYKDATVTAARGAAAEAKNVVTYRMLPDDIGYIRIRTFGSIHMSDELEAALKAMPNAKAYIIDLRDNGGGYVWQSFRAFAQFVDSGKFTEMRGMSNGAAYKEVLEVTANELVDTENGTVSKHTRPKNTTGTKPVVILVNGDSASASEMFSGAMRDNGRAKVVGTQTFGKGIAQNTYNLEGKTSVQITFAEYFFPNGGSIHGTGIKPDSVVTRGVRGDAQLDEAVKIAKDALTP